MFFKSHLRNQIEWTDALVQLGAADRFFVIDFAAYCAPTALAKLKPLCTRVAFAAVT